MPATLIYPTVTPDLIRGPVPAGGLAKNTSLRGVVLARVRVTGPRIKSGVTIVWVGAN